MLRLLKYVNDGITRVMNWLMVTLMSLMVAFIFAQVIFRYVLEKPLSWSEELSGYLFSGVFFFGSVLLYRESRHINMSIVVDSIKNEFARKLLVVAAHLFSFFFLAVMVFLSHGHADSRIRSRVSFDGMAEDRLRVPDSAGSELFVPGRAVRSDP
jgi:TRAP-type C4-dicarboxylate transport system permease small subunit